MKRPNITAKPVIAHKGINALHAKSPVTIRGKNPIYQRK
jgi:hypothetical protein